jgi:hypothetical protein
MLTILVFALAVGAAATTQDRPETRHVRSEQPDVVALLHDGIVRSATLAAIVAVLDASDVVVYMESSRHMPNLSPLYETGRLDGYLVHSVATVGNQRYLRIIVNADLPGDRLISIMAHELQHAVEIAQAVTIRSDAGMRRFFQSLDSGRCAPRCAETKAAKRVQDVVLRELRNRRTTRPKREISKQTRGTRGIQ